jgi:hypothetical protein
MVWDLLGTAQAIAVEIIMKIKPTHALWIIGPVLLLIFSSASAQIGEEVSSYQRLEDGQEHTVSQRELLRRGEAAFSAQWTSQEGGGRPLTKGTGGTLSDPSDPLIFPRDFNRISARDSNGCAGCHNAPFGLVGGGGDFVTGVFVAAQRFDFATFAHDDFTTTKGAMDESGKFADLQNMGNYRATLGMFGSGFIEMLARQMTAEMQAIRDTTPPDATNSLFTKGVSFGLISRDSSGNWDVSQIEGLPAQSLTTSGPGNPPSLVIHPFHQSGSVVSLRQFTNNAFNHHHGIQSAERFGAGVDADGDGFVDELTRADITAVSVFQATLPVPEQVIPHDRDVRKAIKEGEKLFENIGCADCHVPALPLTDHGWIYTEPNPYNPAGNLQVGEAATFAIDLTDQSLPGKRPKPKKGTVWVRAFTDMKIHDISSGPGDPGEEAIDINQPGGSPGFFAGNRSFMTKKLWGAANERPYFHHGKFTTLRQATIAHDGEARDSRMAFEALTGVERDQIVEFLKSLQVVAPTPRHKGKGKGRD